MSEMSVIDNIRLTFLYIEFYSMGKTWVYPESYIPYNIFRYIVKGKAEFCIDGEEIIVKENQIVYIPQGCRMSCRALSEGVYDEKKSKGRLCPLGIRTSSAISCGNPFNLPNLFEFIL